MFFVCAYYLISVYLLLLIWVLGCYLHNIIQNQTLTSQKLQIIYIAFLWMPKNEVLKNLQKNKLLKIFDFPIIKDIDGSISTR